MRAAIPGVWAAVAMGLAAASCGPPPCDCGVPATPGASRDERWRADVQCLAQGLSKCHLKPFFQTDRATFEQQAAALATAIPSLTDAQVIVELARLAASLGDAHTALYLFNVEGFHHLPLQLSSFTDGVFVVDASPAYGDLVGKKVSRIGSTPIAQAATAMEPFIAHENAAWLESVSASYLATGELLAAAGVVSDPAAPVELSLEGAPSPVAVTPEPTPFAGQPAQESAPIYRRHRELNYWFEALPEQKLMVVEYNVCANAKEESFARFTERVFKAVDASGLDRMVIDVRANGGGNSDVINPLQDELARRKSLAQPGKLFVFIGRDTFSSGLMNAVELDPSATLVGEPTGGKPNHYGDTRPLELPNSKLKVSYSTKHFTLVAGDPESLLPEVERRFSSADYFSGADPALSWVLEGR